jgi:hypothetical protein
MSNADGEQRLGAVQMLFGAKPTVLVVYPTSKCAAMIDTSVF